MPKITTSSGRTFKIQFVHSSHDLNKEREVTPGGLRQFVDNLARSIRRRVTLVDISLVFEKMSGLMYESIGQGFAMCHPTDQFKKKDGRIFALDRALLNSDITPEEEDEIWAALTSNADGLPPSRPSNFGH